MRSWIWISYIPLALWERVGVRVKKPQFVPVQGIYDLFSSETNPTSLNEQMQGIKLLIVEESEALKDYLAQLVHLSGHSAQAVDARSEFTEALRLYGPQLVLIGSSFKPGQVRAIVDVVRGEMGRLPIAVVQKNDSQSDIVGLPGDAGVLYLAEDFGHTELKQAIETLMGPCRDPRLEDLDRAIVGSSKAITDVKRHIIRMSEVDATLLIMGESGTGKELVARGVHRLSKRAEKPFIKVNSAAVPHTLIESELFGFEKGAFTGADRKKPGKFELAHHGTIFLDEIGEFPLSVQAKLLQVLEDYEFSSLGGTGNTRVDARIVAATNADLEKMVRRRRFRADLYYRLGVVTIHLPPLRERVGDIDLLCDHFLHKYGKMYGGDFKGLKPETRRWFRTYPWPGNVRELENCVRRLAVLKDEEKLFSRMPPSTLGPDPPGLPRRYHADRVHGNAAEESADATSLKDACEWAARKSETEAIVRALFHTHWNRRKAAELLKVSYKSLLNKIKRYGIEGEYREMLKNSVWSETPH